MERFKLTTQALTAAKPHSIIHSGEILDNEEGMNMSGSGDMLRYVVVAGEIGDWAVYCHFAERSEDWIKMNGDKVCWKDNLKMILDFNEEVWKKYRR